MVKFFPKSYTGQKATDEKYGVVKIATATEAVDTSNNSAVLTPANFDGAIDTLVPDATTTVEGKVQLATDAEAIAASANTNIALIPSNLAALTATNLTALTASDSDAQAKSSAAKYVTPANLAASGFMQWADVTITSAEIKAIETTPIELVAAPAAGSVHLFMGAQLKLNYGGTNAFTETDDNLVIKYENGSGVSVSDTIECTAFITATADTITNAVPVKDQIVAAASAEAKALVLFNPDDAITGNAAGDNTVTVRTYYVTQAL